MIESGYVLFHRKDTALDWQSVEDLRQHRLGATIGYDYGEAFQRAEQDGRLRVQRLAAEEQGLRMLLAGRIDVFPMDKVVGIANLQQGFSREERSRLTFHPGPCAATPCTCCCHARCPATNSSWRASTRAWRNCAKAARSPATCSKPNSR